MAKKKQNISLNLEGLDKVDLKKQPDIESAQSVIEPPKPKSQIKPTPKPRVTKPKPKPTPKPTPPVKTAKGTLPPANKKRASFNIEEDLHRALKEYSFFEEVEMVEYIFEHLVKPDLKAKGYYPPKRRKK
jgi:hypothetical protein